MHIPVIFMTTLGGSTYCPACQSALLIEIAAAWSLFEKGACSRCGTAIAGVFNSGPGNWGARRQPILIQGE